MKAPDTSWPLRRFLDRLASSDPAPGGGSAAALAGALGCALGGMVGRILLSRSGMRSTEKRKLQQGLRELERVRGSLSGLIRRDATAYEQLVRAQRPPPDRRRAGRGGATLLRARRAAIACPLEICRQSVRGMQLMKGFSKKTGPYLGSDLRGGQALLRGAFDSAREMALINLRGGGLWVAGRKLQVDLAQMERDAERWNGGS